MTRSVSLLIEIVLFVAATAGCLATLALTWAVVKTLGPFMDRWARITVLLGVGLPVVLGLALAVRGTGAWLGVRGMGWGAWCSARDERHPV
jgi:hypothetical protein